MRSDAVVTLIVAEAQGHVGIDRVKALVLQAVRAQLVEQPDAASLLAQVEDHPGLLLADGAQRRHQLVAAVTSQRAQCVTGKALAVDADGHVVLTEGIALDDGHVVLAVAVVPEADDMEGPEDGGQVRHGGDPDADVVSPQAITFVVGSRGDELVVGEVPDPRLLVHVHRLTVGQHW